MNELREDTSGRGKFTTIAGPHVYGNHLFGKGRRAGN
jgi:hypothetical protein